MCYLTGAHAPSCIFPSGHAPFPQEFNVTSKQLFHVYRGDLEKHSLKVGTVHQMTLDAKQTVSWGFSWVPDLLKNGGFVPLDIVVAFLGVPPGALCPIPAWLCDEEHPLDVTGHGNDGMCTTVKVDILRRVRPRHLVRHCTTRRTVSYDAVRHIYIYIHMYIYVYVYTHTHTHTHTYTYMYIYIYIYTYISRGHSEPANFVGFGTFR